jgi:hypothetical protein
MNMDSPVVSRDVVAEYDEWHEQMGEDSGDPLRFPWYASVVEEFGTGLTGEALEVGCGRGNPLIGWLTPLRTFALTLRFSGTTVSMPRPPVLPRSSRMRKGGFSPN